MCTESKLQEKIFFRLNEEVKSFFDDDINIPIDLKEIKHRKERLYLNKNWKITTIINNEILFGASGKYKYDNNDSCRKDLFKESNEISSGSSELWTNCLIGLIRKDFIQYIWCNYVNLGDTDDFKYYYKCNSCYGDGVVQCSTCSGRGELVCHYCHGYTYRTCTTCHGSGQCYSNGQYYRCNNCSSGKNTCWSCSGGTIACTSCSGKGKITCGKCRGHCYFTQRYWMTVEAHGKLEGVFSDGLEPWQKEYLENSLKDEVPWAKLNEIVTIDSFIIDNQKQIDRKEYLINCKYIAEIDFLSASAIISDKKSNIYFVGQNMAAYHLGQIANHKLDKLTSYLENVTFPENLNALRTSASQKILEHRHNPYRLDEQQFIQKKLICSSSISPFLLAYENIKIKLDSDRNRYNLWKWMSTGIFYTMLIWLTLSLISMFSRFKYETPWNEWGFFRILNNLNLDFNIFIKSIVEPFTANYMIALVISIAIYITYFIFLRKPTRLSVLTIIFGIAVSFLSLIIINGLFPLVHLYGNFKMTSENLAINVYVSEVAKSTILLPEFLTIGFLISTLRTVRKKHRTQKAFLQKINCPTLYSDLNY